MPALDALRGFAVLAVVVFHFVGAADLRPTTWPMLAAVVTCGVGWVGVDLFFVLSGFLITGTLLDAQASGGPPGRYFGSFYRRRAIRILPPYYVCLAALLAGPFAADLVRAQGWYWLYGQNWYAVLSGHWRVSPLADHLWSLAVEEQFYLVWPLVVWVTPRRRLGAICVAIIGAAFAVRTGLVLTVESPWAAYALTPARADSLAVGALVAVLTRDPQWAVPLAQHAPRVARWALLVSALILVVDLGALNGPRVQTAGMTTLALGFGAVMALAATRPTVAAWGPAWARRLGVYSYGVYLWHYPLVTLLPMAGVRPGDLGRAFGSPLIGALAFAVIGLLLATSIAALSWHGAEAPLLARHRAWESHRAVLGRGGARTAPILLRFACTASSTSVLRRR